MSVAAAIGAVVTVVLVWIVLSTESVSKRERMRLSWVAARGELADPLG